MPGGARAPRWFTPQLDQLKLTGLLTEIELPLVPVLADMEWTGIAIDRELFHRLSSELTQELAALERDIAQQSASDLNLNSPKQLAVLLFDKLQLPILKKTKTGPSTDADVLEQLAGLGHEVPRLILEYRELQKLKSTYVDVLPERVNRSPGGSTPASIRPERPPAGSARPIRTCRTFRSARRGAR
jgi:DNA polymerase I - 3''-5'' exonuclease and polymerase domains